MLDSVRGGLQNRTLGLSVSTCNMHRLTYGTETPHLLLFLLPTKTMITPFEVSWMLPEVPENRKKRCHCTTELDEKPTSERAVSFTTKNDQITNATVGIDIPTVGTRGIYFKKKKVAMHKVVI